MKKLIFMTLLGTVSFYSQVVEQWVSRYNGPANVFDKAASIVVDNSGNIYVTGASTDTVTNTDYATIKYNPDGVEQWVARYNGPGNGQDNALAIAVDDNGNVYVTGESVGIGTNYDFATVKYNSNGVEQWTARYNGPGNSVDKPYSIAVDESGNVFVAGFSSGIGTSYYATLKYDSSGIQQWASLYNGPGNGFDAAYAMKIDNEGNVYVTGASTDTGAISINYATVKYNSGGIEQWVARYNGPGTGNDVAGAITLDSSGNVYITGSSYGAGSSDDYATVKYNSEGVEQWVSRYNGPGNGQDVATSIAVDNTGNIYVTGRSIGIGTNYDFATVKYSSSGAEQWVARYNGSANGPDRANRIVLDNSGDVYITGSARLSGTAEDYATIKYNQEGLQQWIQTYNGPGDGIDEANCIAIDILDNVYVTGYSFGNGTNYDYATIKYSQSITGMEVFNSSRPDQFQLFQNYPNPFNPVTKIKFACPKRDSSLPGGAMGGLVTLKVYDLLGNEIATLINEEKQPGYYEVEFDASSLPSGVYFYQLRAGDPSAGSRNGQAGQGFVSTKKLLLLK